MAKKSANCPPKTIQSPKNTLCCNEDDVLAKQLERMFGLPDPQHCTDEFYYLGFNCDTGFANQSLTQLVQTLVNEGITVNVAGILVQAGPNVNDIGNPNGIKVTQTGTVFTVQLNTAGLSVASNILAVNGLTKIGNTIQLGGELIQDTTINGSALNWNCFFEKIGAFKIETILMGMTINGSFGANNYVLTADGSGTCEWKPPVSTLPPLQNALENNAGTLQWNGDLTLAKTEIRGLGTKDIDFQNIREFWLGANKLKLRINGTTGAPGQVFTALGTGFCEWQNLPTLSGGLTGTANGLHTIGPTAYLGGTLTDINTIIQGGGLESFKILGLGTLEFDTFLFNLKINGTFGTSGQVLTSTGSGSTWQTSPAALTADNGLTITTGNMQLGGLLVQDTSIFGGNLYDMFFNAIQTYRIEAQQLTISVNGSSGAVNQIITADGTGFCSWLNPQLNLPIRLDINPTVTITSSDTTVIFDSTGSAQIGVLPPVVEGKIYILTPRLNTIAVDIVPNGAEKIYAGNAFFTGGSPYSLFPSARVILHGKVTGSGNFWMVISTV